MSGTGPRRIGDSIRELAGRVEPRTPLARVQACWEAAAGPEFVARCRPVAEREGVVTVACESAVWAQELDLRQAEVVERLRRESGLETLSRLRVKVGDGE